MNKVANLMTMNRMSETPSELASESLDYVEVIGLAFEVVVPSSRIESGGHLLALLVVDGRQLLPPKVSR